MFHPFPVNNLSRAPTASPTIMLICLVVPGILHPQHETMVGANKEMVVYKEGMEMSGKGDHSY